MDTDGQPRCWFRWCTLQARPASEVTCGHSSVLQAFDTGSVSKPFQEDKKRIWRIVVVFPFFWPPSRTRTQPHTQRCNIYILFTSMFQYNMLCIYIHTRTHTYIYIWYRYSRTIDICIHVCSSPIIYGMTAYFPQSLHQVCESGFWLSAGMIQSGPEGELGRIQAPPVSSVSPGWKWQLFIFDL